MNGLIGTASKLQILRQLVDYQLQHSALIRDIIDTVWGARPAKHRKGAKKEAPSPAAEGYTKKQLMIEPIGQDRTRKRFWTLDGMLNLFQLFPLVSCDYTRANITVVTDMNLPYEFLRRPLPFHTSHTLYSLDSSFPSPRDP